MTPALRQDQSLGATALSKAIIVKYKLSASLNYSKVWEARELALARIRGTAWEDSFQLLYAFKGEVEKASPGSVVEIDNTFVGSTLNGSFVDRNVFRRAFVSFKACHEGFRKGCIHIWLWMQLL